MGEDVEGTPDVPNLSVGDASDAPASNGGMLGHWLGMLGVCEHATCVGCELGVCGAEKTGGRDRDVERYGVFVTLQVSGAAKQVK